MTDMDMREDEAGRRPSPRRSSLWPWVVLAVVLTPLLALIIFAVITLGGALQAWHAVDNLFAGRLVLRTEQPAVVTEVRQLNRLETASFTIEKVIEGGVDQGSGLLNMMLGDRLLFIAHGEVIAGVDLSELRPEDVVVHDDQSVTVQLPAAHILSHRLDNDQSRVYDRQEGLLTKGDPDLETRVRQTAEQQILLAACQAGILAQANANAETQVRTLLLTMGLKQVEFLPARPSGDSGC